MSISSIIGDGIDGAVIPYPFNSTTRRWMALIDMHYNCIKVFLHSTWAFIQPLTNDFGQVKVIV